MNAPILVTGATGNTGAAVSRLLTAEGVAVREASRHPGPGGVRFDWADPSTYADALAGVERMYLVAPIGEPEPAPIVRRCLEIGLCGSLRRIVLLSSSATEPGDAGLGALHRLVTERAPEWVVLRPSWFMQNFVGGHPVAQGLREGTVTTATGDGRMGFIDAEDIAAVAARCLLDGDASNSELVLTGPDALSYADVCALVGELTGRSIRHLAVGTAERAEQIAAAGVPAAFAALLAAMDEAISRGSEDRVTDSVPRVIGRPARSVVEFLGQHRAIL